MALKTLTRPVAARLTAYLAAGALAAGLVLSTSPAAKANPSVDIFDDPIFEWAAERKFAQTTPGSARLVTPARQVLPPRVVTLPPATQPRMEKEAAPAPSAALEMAPIVSPLDAYDAIPADGFYDPVPPWTASEGGIPSFDEGTAARMETARRHYEAIAEAGGWPSIPSGALLEEGESDARVALLRKRLEIAGDLAEAGGEGLVFGPALTEAVKRFQARHGLDTDGVVGPHTLAALNVPARQRAAELDANIMRVQDVVSRLGSRYVLVNIPGQELEAVAHGAVDIASRVIVGKPSRETPEYSSEIRAISFNPYWHVPLSIVRKDIIPKVVRDPSYLDRQNIRVLTSWGPNARELSPAVIQWASASASDFRLRQDPGPHNALGTIKIDFPNPHAVYLHDTSTPRLFDREVRAESSGCVRVEKIEDLTAWLMRANDGWSRERIDRTVASRDSEVKNLALSVPVHLVYVTAWVGADGSVQFRDDIYGKVTPYRTASL